MARTKHWGAGVGAIGLALVAASAGGGCASTGAGEQEGEDPLALESTTVEGDRASDESADPMLLQSSSDRAGGRAGGRGEVQDVEPIEVAQVAPAPSREHVVARGETLYSIARQYYGDPRQWRRIEEANRDRFPSVNRISVGTRLRIP